MATRKPKDEPVSFDRDTESALASEGMGFARASQRVPMAHGDPKAPPQAAGLPGLAGFMTPGLTGTGTSGFVVSPQKLKSHEMAQVMFLDPARDPEYQRGTAAHEAEHLLARQGLGHASRINKKFDELIGGGKGDGMMKRFDFVTSAVEAAPYLEQKYGWKPNAYFQQKMVDFQGHLAPNLLYEQLASLASLEATKGVDLTKDPELRKTLFKDKDVREAYNAITGLRQTRLDARDLPPYTRQPEDAPRLKDPEPTGMVDKLKGLLPEFVTKPLQAAGRKRDI